MHNLTISQHNQLKDLKNDKSIVIQNADKGGALVILDWAAYNQEATRQLNTVHITVNSQAILLQISKLKYMTV